MTPVYLDNNATTPVDPAVLKAMLPFLQDQFGNPSSAHALGHRAHDAVEHARAQVAALIGASAEEITFTSGGTEASNIAIRGGAVLDKDRSAVVTTAIEHPATEACCAFLEKSGHAVTRIKPTRDGVVDADAMASAVTERTALVTVIHAQNEVGTLQPVGDIAARAKVHRPLVHTDVAQSLGKVRVDVEELGIDLMSIAGHKLYAPKGIGALYTRRGTVLPPLLLGAGQEHGRRAGTENVPYFVALGEACRLAGEALAHAPRVAALADTLFAKLKSAVPDIILVGEKAKRLPNTLNVLFPRVSGRQLLQICPQVMASNGSACHADSEDPSAILLALGYSREQALGSVRLSLGRHTTTQDVETAANALAAAWRTLSAASQAAE